MGPLHQDGVGRAWRDPAFKRALMADPRTALRTLGIIIPRDIAVKAVGSRGAPSDKGDTLLQFVLERERRVAYFFMPSPSHPSAQNAAYGTVIGSSPDDPVFSRRLHADATLALRSLGVSGTISEARP
jgi:hypothetical protein